MKRTADRLEKVTLIGDVADLWFSLCEDNRQHAVVRRDKELASHLSQDWPARGPDTWVDYNHENRPCRIVGRSPVKKARAIKNGKWRHLMCEIDNANLRHDRIHHATADGD